tara:strand:+ start:3118 stop:4290 length:1173 start_codon:yes stop_codon:yes gene_type:complete
MNILVVSHNQKGWTYETLFNEHQLLKKKGKNNYFFWGPGYDFETNDVLQIIQKYKKKDISFDIIYICQSQQDLIGKYNFDHLPKSFYKEKFEYFPINLHKVKIPKVLVVGDFWIINKYEWEYIFKKFDIKYAISIVLNHYAPPKINEKFLSNFTKKNLKFFNYVRTIPEFPNLRGKKKKYDFVSLGAKEIKFYPNRLYFENTLKKSYLNEENKIITAEHPGYKYNNKDKKKYFGKRYLKLLSESHFMITDTTDMNIPLIKHLECMYYGCVMVCDKIYFDKKNKLKKGYNYIEINRENVEKTITYLKQNKNKMLQIKNNAYKTYQEYYSNKIFVKRIESYFKVILNDYNEINYKFNFKEKIILKCKIFTLNIIKLIKKIFFKLLNIKKFVY